ncbi:hypothetical protein UlMin_015223 [Ulmus minor]
MWRRTWLSSGGLLLRESLKKVVGHGGKGRNAFPFSSPSLSSSYSSYCRGFWGLRAIANLEIVAPESFDFPALLSIGSNRVFSSSSSSSSPSKSPSLSANYGSKSRERDDDDVDEIGPVGEAEAISFAEAKRLMRLVNVEALKMRLGAEGKEFISYCELLEACESIGVARSPEEAAAFARILDEAGVILLFRDKVYLHPDKVVDQVRKAVPIALTPDNDPMRDEFRVLLEKKEEIDVTAHSHVRRVLWSGLVLALFQVGLFFRLTFWEFSWDVMEPVAFFTTTTGLVVGYAYFLITSRDPTYQDFMKRLFLSRQRKLFKKRNFDLERFKELHRKYKITHDCNASIKNRVGLEVDLDDALHKD